MPNLFSYVEKESMNKLDKIWMVIASSAIGIHECTEANSGIEAEDQGIKKE